MQAKKNYREDEEDVSEDTQDQQKLDQEFMENASLATSTNDVNIGVPQTVKSQCVSQLRTCNGDNLYDKILTGFKPILFPTAVSENCCFEYRFSIKDLILPSELPKVTNLYFRDLVVKIQDMFTQLTASECIKDSIIYSYQPYSAVLAQDENGIEIQYHKYYNEMTPFITSDRLTKRDSSPLFVVSSNLKYNRRFNLEDVSNSYQAIIVEGIYEGGVLKKRVLKTQTHASPLQIKQAIESDNDEKKPDGTYCMDIIFCDMLIYCLKSFNLEGKKLSDLKLEDIEKQPKTKRSVPIGWLSPEEKLKEFGMKGKFRAEFNEKKAVPANLFIYVDGKEMSEKTFKAGIPESTAFFDKNGLICPAKNCYAVTNMLLSVRAAGDN